MTHSRTSAALLLCLAAALPLSACTQGADPADLTASDAAFKGVTATGGTAVAPAPSRVVRIGLSGPQHAACGSPVKPTAATVNVYWANGTTGPVKARVASDVMPCEVDGASTGIVFPAPGQDISDCAVDVAVRDQREYQGPCRWGWVESRALAAPAAA